MEAVQVAQYVSDSSDVGILAENNEISRNQKQRKRTKHWIKEDVSDTAIEAWAGDTRSKHHTSYSENGRRLCYRCKKSKNL